MRLRGLDWSERGVQGCARAVRVVSATWSGTIIVMLRRKDDDRDVAQLVLRVDYLLGSSAGFT